MENSDSVETPYLGVHETGSSSPLATEMATHSSRMNQEEVIETVNAAIRSRMPDGDPARLAIAERPRLANRMVWSICESTKGTWWEAKDDDATGELVSLLRKGLR